MDFCLEAFDHVEVVGDAGARDRDSQLQILQELGIGHLNSTWKKVFHGKVAGIWI